MVIVCKTVTLSTNRYPPSATVQEEKEKKETRRINWKRKLKSTLIKSREN